MRTTLLRLTLPAIALSATLSLAEIPGNEDDKKFDDFVKNLDLEASESYEFHFKDSGTSVGFKISEPDKRKKGMFVPENSATHLEGEVIAYRLSRYLGVSDIFNPSAYYTLGPQAINRFSGILRSSESNKWRRENTGNIRSAIAKSPDSLLGIYKYRSKRESQGVEILASGNRFNTSQSFAKFLTGGGTMPGTDTMSFRGIVPDEPGYPAPLEMECVLADQLSTIFVIDALCGQWDRFSGGNIEVYAHKSGRLQFVGRDNGGSNLLWGRSWYSRYKGWVTRFDKPLIEELRKLNQFLGDQSTPYHGLSDKPELQKQLGFMSDSSFAEFEWRVKDFVEVHVPACEKKYGEAAYFKIPAPDSESEAGPAASSTQ